MQDTKIKIVNGVVVSKSGDKSIKVVVDYKIKHPRYGKYVKRRSKLSVHDEHNKAGLGDVVEVTRCRPISKTKNWRLISVIEKAIQP